MADLYPFQRQLLIDIESGGCKPGEMRVMMSGRQAGKSQLTQAAVFRRMFNDIYSRPVEDLVISEGTVYGSRYYTIEPIGGSWPDMEAWCLDSFGPTGSIWSESKNLTPEPLQRWYSNNRKFWFKSPKDRDWFVMRWRS